MHATAEAYKASKGHSLNHFYEDFQDLYMQAWKSGLKGLATYRPNSVLGSVLSVTSEPAKTEGNATVDAKSLLSCPAPWPR